MTSVADIGGEIVAGVAAIHRLKDTEPPLYLTPSPEISTAARLASQYLFSLNKPYAPKSPFSQLLTEGFDAEQIWQQIDLQAQPLLASLRRHVRSFEKNPEEIEKQFNFDKACSKIETVNPEIKESKGVESESDDELDDDDDEEEEEDEDDEHDGGSDDEDEDEEEKENVSGVEDKFLKIKELEEYLVEDEAREYGDNEETTKNRNKRKRGKKIEDENEESEDEEEEDEDEDDELGLMGLDDDEEGNEMENARSDTYSNSLYYNLLC